jgi:hypothetical protein
LALALTAGLFVGAIAIAAAVLFTWGWEISLAAGADASVPVQRVAAATSALTLLLGVPLARSVRSLAREFLDHQRRAARVHPAGAKRQEVRNRRFLAVSSDSAS